MAEKYENGRDRWMGFVTVVVQLGSEHIVSRIRTTTGHITYLKDATNLTHNHSMLFKFTSIPAIFLVQIYFGVLSVGPCFGFAAH